MEEEMHIPRTGGLAWPNRQVEELLGGRALAGAGLQPCLIKSQTRLLGTGLRDLGKDKDQLLRVRFPESIWPVP
jgi:hypothetical protein